MLKRTVSRVAGILGGSMIIGTIPMVVLPVAVQIITAYGSSRDRLGSILLLLLLVQLYLILGVLNLLLSTFPPKNSDSFILMAVLQILGSLVFGVYALNVIQYALFYYDSFFTFVLAWDIQKVGQLALGVLNGLGCLLLLISAILKLVIVSTRRAEMPEMSGYQP